MSDYRLYCLDSDGHIALANWIEAGDDDEADAKARKIQPDAQKCEVWLKNRLVAKLNTAGHLERVEP